MASFGGFDFNHLINQDNLGRQVAGLSREMSHISSALRRAGVHTGHDAVSLAGNFADSALHQGARAARLMGRQARKAGKAVGRDPAPAIVAVAGLACLLSLVMSSGSPRRR